MPAVVFLQRRQAEQNKNQGVLLGINDAVDPEHRRQKIDRSQHKQAPCRRNKDKKPVKQPQAKRLLKQNPAADQRIMMRNAVNNVVIDSCCRIKAHGSENRLQPAPHVENVVNHHLIIIAEHRKLKRKQIERIQQKRKSQRRRTRQLGFVLPVKEKTPVSGGKTIFSGKEKLYRHTVQDNDRGNACGIKAKALITEIKGEIVPDIGGNIAS